MSEMVKKIIGAVRDGHRMKGQTHMATTSFADMAGAVDRNVALSVLTALREPTREMVEAAWPQDCSDELIGAGFSGKLFEHAWERMIDAAIKECQA